MRETYIAWLATGPIVVENEELALKLITQGARVTVITRMQTATAIGIALARMERKHASGG